MSIVPRAALLSLLPAMLPGCASDAPVWAVHHASVLPSETGLSGTQTWEFFSDAWARSGSPDAFVCTRAQSLSGTLIAAADGCEGCDAAYLLEVTEIESDCEGDLATSADFVTPRAIAIGELPEEGDDLDPYPGRSMGWYLSTGGEALSFYGYAYDEALDWAGDVGVPGWKSGQTYTLWPAYAWNLQE